MSVNTIFETHTKPEGVLPVRLMRPSKNLITCLTMAYIICIYPLIYQLYPNGSIYTINRTLLFVLVVLFAFSNKSFSGRFLANPVNALILFSSLYIVYSLLMYSSNLTFSDLLRELLYTIVPVIFYYIVDTFDEKRQQQIVRITVLCLSFVIFIGILDLFGFNFSNAWVNALERKGKANFISYFSPISMGYAAQLLFALTLFKLTCVNIISKYRPIFLVLFLIVSILTLQRAAYLGIIFSSILYALNCVVSSVSKRKLFIQKKTILLLASGAFLLSMAFVFIDWSSVWDGVNAFLGLDIRSLVSEEIASLNLDVVQHDRRNQAIIFNNENISAILFGEGFGKYSPNNMNAIVRMPDASYYRIYNELGIFGFVLFFLPYLIMLINAILGRNTFAVYFIVHTFLAFFFNRVLWMIPLSFIIFPLLSICQKKSSLTTLKQEKQCTRE